MRIAITGGHFSPAHSVIKKLNKNDNIIVIGRRFAFEGDANETYEYQVCKKEGIASAEINAGRLQRKLTAHSIPAALKFPKGIYDAIKILKDFNPDVVVTFGGYVGLPVALAASILKIPVVLHEQTQNAGLSGKLIAKVASVICVSFDTSLKHFKNKNVLLTGNPIREEILKSKNLKPQTSKPIVYITGGSTGSHAINNVVYEILPELLQEFIVIHQTGNSKETKDFERFEGFHDMLDSKIRKNYILSEFFTPDEVASFMGKATLVVSRSGINTVLELMSMGTVSLFIPLPIGQKNEQLENARLFANTGLGEYILQKDLTPNLLLSKMRAMIKEQKKYHKNVTNAQKYVHYDAAEKIVEQIYFYGKRREERRTSQIPKD